MNSARGTGLRRTPWWRWRAQARLRDTAASAGSQPRLAPPSAGGVGAAGLTLVPDRVVAGQDAAAETT